MSFSYLKYSYVVSAGTDGGASTSGSWQTMPLNTEDSDTGGYGSLSANVVTLAAGAYVARFYMALNDYCGYNLGASMRLYNVTGSATLILGQSGQMESPISEGYFSIGSSTNVRLDYWCYRSVATNGLGYNANQGVNEVYAMLELWREEPPAYAGVLKVYNGASWVKKPMKVCVGGSFVAKPVKRWTGSAWSEIDVTGV